MSFTLSAVLMLSPVGLATETDGPAVPDGAATVPATGNDLPTTAREEAPGLVAADVAARHIVEATGDLYALSRLAFTFIVESGDTEKVRRSHVRDWEAGTATVEVNGDRVALHNLHTRDPSEGVADPAAHAEMWTAVAPGVPPATAARAWSTWVNDSYWLLASAKLMDAGVLRSMDEQGRLLLRFDGVGLTPADRYALTFDAEQHRITAWEFTLQSGRKGRFTWTDYQTVGPLTLSMVRANEAADFVVRFEAVEPTP